MSTKHVFCHKMPPLSSDDFAIELENSPDSCQLPAGALTIEPLSETTDILHLPCKVLTSALQGWLKSTHLIGTSGPPRGPVSFRSQAQTCRCPIRNLVRPAASSLFASATFLPPLALCFSCCNIPLLHLANLTRPQASDFREFCARSGQKAPVINPVVSRVV